MSVSIYTNGTQLTTDEQEAGRLAALAMFDLYGADVTKCHAAKVEIDNFYKISGDFYKMTGVTISSTIRSYARIWREAENAAICAATKDWSRMPDDLSLGLA